VRKVSIIPRGRALGVTLQTPEADRYAYSEEYLRGRIIGAHGGRAAEEVVFGEITTGAENDLVLVTQLARNMVGRWGMSDRIGPLSVVPENGGGPFATQAVAPDTQALVDEEARRIVDECYQRALDQLKQHREKLDALSEALLEKETLEEREAYEIAGMQPQE
jgi:cell division protease FtsH